MEFNMKRYAFIAIMMVLFFLAAHAFGQEPNETAVVNKTIKSSIFTISANDFASILTILIFCATILLIVVITARNYSNTSKILLEKSFEKNREMPEELQVPVSAIIKSFPQAEPLGLPRGSLRAIVLLIFTLAFIFMLFIPSRQTGEVSWTLEIILALIMGFYFGSRYAESKTVRAEPVEKVPVPEEVRSVKDLVIKEITPVSFPEKHEEKKKKGKKREELI
jgi:hypothetical protein